MYYEENKYWKTQAYLFLCKLQMSWRLQIFWDSLNISVNICMLWQSSMWPTYVTIIWLYISNFNRKNLKLIGELSCITKFVRPIFMPLPHTTMGDILFWCGSTLVCIGVASCLHSVSWMDKWILTKTCTNTLWGKRKELIRFRWVWPFSRSQKVKESWTMPCLHHI